MGIHTCKVFTIASAMSGASDGTSSLGDVYENYVACQFAAHANRRFIAKCKASGLCTSYYIRTVSLILS